MTADPFILDSTMKSLPVILFWTALLYAASAAAMNLADAVNAALAIQPGAQLPAARLSESQAINRQASSLFAGDPEFALQHFNDKLGSGDGVREWDLGLQAPIWLPGQRDARRSVGSAAQEQASALDLMRRWEVAGLVRERMWDVLLARARVEHFTRALNSARDLEAAVQQRVAAGESPRSELLLARRETLSQQEALQSANVDLDQARQVWRFNTGLDSIPDDSLETPAPDGGIADNHPGLAQAMADAARATAERDRAISERRGNPVLSLGTRIERGAAGESWNDAIAVGLNVPLGLSSQSAPAIAAADFALTEASVARVTIHRTLQQNLIVARQQLVLTRQSLKTAEQVRDLADESMKMTQRAFDLGEVDLFTLLQMRAQVLDKTWQATLLKLQTGRDIARFNQALGVIPR